MMRKKTGIICMLLGAVLIASALLLIAHNNKESDDAGKASEEVLQQLEPLVGDGDAAEDSDEMTTKTINGYDYIGYVSIPALELKLPVMADWDYERLTIAPCRHFGSTKTNDLVIAGHNYVRHFAYLKNLQVGDAVRFTDMDGLVWYYEVGAMETLAPTQVEEMRNSSWDLTLYTCTYGNRSRVTVRCRLLKTAPLKEE